jgi:hypothetical protein
MIALVGFEEGAFTSGFSPKILSEGLTNYSNIYRKRYIFIA